MRTFIHVQKVWSGRLGLRVGVNLSKLQIPGVVCGVFLVVLLGCFVSKHTHTHTCQMCPDTIMCVYANVHGCVPKRMRVLQQELIVLQTLGSSASYDGGDGPPLGGHQLGQVKQLLLLLPRPLGLLDAGVQSFIPAHTANKCGRHTNGRQYLHL